MKLFREWNRGGPERSLRCFHKERSDMLATRTWRRAFETIRKEIVANPVVGDGLANILDFIDEELNE